MIYVTVTAGTAGYDDATGDHIPKDWHEFWIEEEHAPNLLGALGLLSNNLTIAQALELIK